MRQSIRKWTGVLVAAAFAASAGTVHAQAREKISVVLDFLPWGIHGPMHLAKAKGWFDQAGLDVDIQDGKGTLSGIQLVGAGRVDVGAVQLGPMAVAREQNLPVTSIAGFARRGDLAIMVDEKTGPKDAKGLAGKKLVCFTGSPWVPFINSFGKNAGLTEEQFKVTMVAAPAMVSSYASGDADGFLSLAPFGVPLVAKSRPARAILAVDQGIQFPSYGLVVSEDTLKKRPDALKKLVQVQIRAWEYIYKEGNYDEAVKAIIAARPDAKLDPDLIRGQVVAYKDFIETPSTKGKKYGWQSDQDWLDAIKSMEAAGAIKPGRKPSEYYTNALVD